MSSFFKFSHIQFFFEMFRNAIEGVEGFFLAYALCIVLFFIIGKKLHSAVFVYPPAFMALTIFNPFVIVPVSEIIGLTTRIRRLFWLMPVNLVLAYAAAYLCTGSPAVRKCSAQQTILTGLSSGSVSIRQKQKKQLYAFRLAAMLLAVACIVRFGTSTGPWLVKPQNIYKTSNTVISIANLLEEDSSAHGLRKKVLYSSTQLLELRQYDPSIESSLRRNELLSFDIDPGDEAAVQQVLDSGHRLRALALVSRYGVRIDPEIFRSYAERAGITYIISENTSGMSDYFRQTGYEYLDSIGIYDIFRKTLS